MENKTTYTLAIPYSNASARSRAKKAGAKWNGTNWILTIAPSRFNYYPQLHGFVVSETTESTEKTFDTGLGFHAANTDAERARVARLGFDAIED